LRSSLCLTLFGIPNFQLPSWGCRGCRLCQAQVHRARGCCLTGLCGGRCCHVRYHADSMLEVRAKAAMLFSVVLHNCLSCVACLSGPSTSASFGGGDLHRARVLECSLHRGHTACMAGRQISGNYVKQEAALDAMCCAVLCCAGVSWCQCPWT
jgi:hypothetical protein